MWRHCCLTEIDQTNVCLWQSGHNILPKFQKKTNCLISKLAFFSVIVYLVTSSSMYFGVLIYLCLLSLVLSIVELVSSVIGRLISSVVVVGLVSFVVVFLVLVLNVFHYDLYQYPLLGFYLSLYHYQWPLHNPILNLWFD